MRLLPAYMHMYYMHTWYLLRSEEDVSYPGAGLQTTGSHHVGVINKTRLLCKSTKGSQLLIIF